MTCVVRPPRGTVCTYAHIRICSDSSARLARESERARPPDPTAACAAHLGCGSITALRCGYPDHPVAVVDAAHGTDDGGGAAGEHLQQPALLGGHRQLGHRHLLL